MTFDRERTQRLIVACLLGLLALAAVALLQSALTDSLQNSSPLLLLVLPVMIAAWFGGLWPGLVLTVTGALVAAFFYMPPSFSWQIAERADATSLLIYLGCGVAISLFCERLHAARRNEARRRRALEREMEERREASESVNQRERQLREAHDHVVTALEGMTDGFHRFDREWKYVYVNTAAELLAGRPRAELLGQSLWDAEPALLGTRVEKEYRRAIGEQVIVAWDHHDEIRGRWLAIRAFPTSDGGLASFVRDITHQRQAEEALAESQRLEHARRIELEAIMASAPAAIMIAHDLDCTRITGNAAAYALLRLAPGTNIAHSGATAESPLPFVIHRGGAAILPEELPMRVAARTGQPVAAQELEFRFADGASVWVFGNAQPLVDERGQVRGAISTFVDITARIQAEKRLRQSERLYRAIGESIDYGVWVCDADGRNVYNSPAFLRLVGLTQEQCSEFNWAHVLHPEEAESTIEAWKECVRTRGTWDHEHRFKGVDGVWHPVLARGVPILDDHDRVVCWAGISLDIGRLKQAEDGLKEADRRKNEFLAMLAHELRNPLAPIRNAIQLLKLKGSPDDEEAWSRDVIDRQIGQMARLLDDLLDVSRITRNKLELRRQRVSLASVMESAIETSRPVIEICGHELSIRLPGEQIQLDVDPIRLAQVFSNLLNNAAKYTDRGGRISLSAERQGSEVAVTIADTGMGIAPEMLPQLFEIFSQAEPALERSQGGLGIGLSLVKGLVELHDGSIEVHSDGPGKGSTFMVRLPLVIGPVPLSSPSLLDAATASTGISRRVLVVDDNRDGADSLAALLTIRGHEVHAAYDGLAGVEAARALRPDIVLLDIGMPRLNGYDAARHIRQQDWGRDLMLVALTGWGQDDDRRRTKAAGFNHHLVKPVDPAELMQLLAELEPSGV